TVVSFNDRFTPVSEANQIPELGRARLGPQDLSQFLESAVASFGPSSGTPRTEGSSILHRMQPSQVLNDGLGNYFILRVSEAQPEHPPQTLAEVQPQVQADLVAQQTYAIIK